MMDMEKERQEFKAWVESQGMPMSMSQCLSMDEYRPTAKAWEAWQARAALAPAAGEALSDEEVHRVLRNYFVGATAEQAQCIAHDLLLASAVAQALVAAPASEPARDGDIWLCMTRDGQITARSREPVKGLNWAHYRRVDAAPIAAELAAEPHVCRITVKNGKLSSYAFSQLQGEWVDGEHLLYRKAPAAQEQARGMVPDEPMRYYPDFDSKVMRESAHGAWVRYASTLTAEMAGQEVDVDSGIEAVIACLGDDAAMIREELPEMAANMDKAAELLASKGGETR